MPYPISVQLFSLRNEMKDGKHAEIIKKIAEMGYRGVEGAGLYGMKPADFRKLVESTGMVISSNHGPFPTKDNMNEVVELTKSLGCAYAIAGFGPNEFKDEEAIKRVAEKTNVAIEGMAKAGLTFAMHNHWAEFERLGGKLKYDILLQQAPKLQLQIDTYWACNFGAEKPAEMVAKLKSRTPLLHVKDGDFVKGQPHVACGKGKQDLKAVVSAADPKILKWVVVELDECATDMVQAVRDSYDYLVGQGLATGNKAVAKQ